MSLQLSYSVKFSSDCLYLTIEDITGDYSASNVTGYGAPNPTRASILSTKADITLPDGSVISNITLTSPSTVPTITDLKASTLSLSAFAEGIYTISITEKTLTDTYNKVINVLNTCSTRCCLDKLISTLDPDSCSASDETIKRITKIEYYLQAAVFAASCSKFAKATKNLKAAQDMCAQINCGCNK